MTHSELEQRATELGIEETVTPLIDSNQLEIARDIIEMAEYYESENNRLSTRLNAEHNHQLRNFKRKLGKELYSDYKQWQKVEGGTDLEKCLLDLMGQMFEKLQRNGILFEK